MSRMSLLESYQRAARIKKLTNQIVELKRKLDRDTGKNRSTLRTEIAKLESARAKLRAK